MQLPQGREILTSQLETMFNEQFDGSLEVEDIGGMIPFNITLHNARVYAPGENREPVVSVPEAALSLNVWDLLRRTITISGFELIEPEMIFLPDEEGNYRILDAFTHTSRSTQAAPDAEQRNVGPFQVYAPNLLIRNGRFTAETTFIDPGILGENREFVAENLNTSLLLDISSSQRLLDIDHFSADLPGTLWEQLHLSGQIYSDGNYLEFNGFSLTTAGFHFQFAAEASPVDILSPSFSQQLAAATYDFQLTNSSVELRNLSSYFPQLGNVNTTMELNLEISGTADSLWIDNLMATTPQSSLLISGLAKSIGTSDFNYEATVSNLILGGDELQQLTRQQLSEEQRNSWAESRLSGLVTGTQTTLNTDIRLRTPRGGVDVEGSANFSSPASYDAYLTADSLDISTFFPTHFDSTRISGTADFTGSGLSLDELSGTLTADFFPGFANQLFYNSGNLKIDFENGRIDHDLAFEMMNGGITMTGSFRPENLSEQQALSVSGSLENINLQQLLSRGNIPQTSLNLSFNADITGNNIDNLFGRISYEAAPSVVRGDSVRAHQLYADLNAPSESSRSLRLTSTFLDARIEGDITPSNLTGLYGHWSQYMQERLSEEVYFDSARANAPGTDSDLTSLEPANIQLNLQLKDADILQSYFPDNPIIESQGFLDMSLDADSDRLVITGTASDQNLVYRNVTIENLRGNLTAGFRYNQSLHEYSVLDLQLNAGHLTYRGLDFQNAGFATSMRDDSLNTRFSSESTSDDVSFGFNTVAKMLPGQIEFTLNDFHLGNEEYEWQSEGSQRFIYTENQTLMVDGLLLRNESERIGVNGTFSSRFEDSIEYNISNLQLDKISSLLGGRITFDGILNGNFITRTLTQVPSFQGNITVNELMINNRLVGDVEANSVYFPEEEQFKTDMSVRLDPEVYPEFYTANDSVGTDLVFSGYIRPPDETEPDRNIFYFDADFQEIDMWIATVIVPGIVSHSEGSASGSGYISGTLDDYDFNAQFNLNDVIAGPVLLNTEYSINGDLEFDRTRGLDFNNLLLTDSGGGSGVLSGNINQNNFSTTTTIDLTLDLDNLHFFNNPYDPDIPFYADARGTGQARVTGTNFNPYLRTTEPIVITQGSRISVPVTDETDLEQTYNFIRFVEEFELDGVDEQQNGNEGNGNGRSQTEDLSFSERFTLDLQFNVQNPVVFQLVFDPVTSEILTANSTGQLRLELQDQAFSMYGRMNIIDGDYLFVAGDIISRRFMLQNGGTITWEGDPANARLDVNAVYSARPDLSSLQSTGTGGQGQEGGQRFQIDLNLNIGGTLGEPENDFFFSVPSGIQGTLDPAVTTQINNLNRNEEEKLLQATSILLTGSFIPQNVIAENGSGSAFRQNLAGGGAIFVNPLITSQVINPLLSNQINSLLRSDMSMDFDFNLTAYNQIDLGVALRLYNDRLILRRDGQITGTQSDIGDLGATYRISRTFALTAFHRQDPTLSNTSGTETRQSQEMNGIGLEAQVQFTSWQRLRERIGTMFRRLFGIKETTAPISEETSDGPLAADPP